MRYCIYKQLEVTGAENPALGGYLYAYDQLEKRQGKLSPTEARETEMKVFATAKKNNFQPFLNLIRQKEIQVMIFEPHESYYNNLKLMTPNNDIQIEGPLVGGTSGISTYKLNKTSKMQKKLSNNKNLKTEKVLPPPPAKKANNSRAARKRRYKNSRIEAVRQEVPTLIVPEKAHNPY